MNVLITPEKQSALKYKPQQLPMKIGLDGKLAQC